MINGQLTQIGVVRGGQAVTYCRSLRFHRNAVLGQIEVIWRLGYGEFSDWTPINLFLQWINENNPLRQVTAAAGNFNWSNPAAWIDSVTGMPSCGAEQHRELHRCRREKSPAITTSP